MGTVTTDVELPGGSAVATQSRWIHTGVQLQPDKLFMSKGPLFVLPGAFIRRRPLEHLQLALARRLSSHRGRLLRVLPLSISRCVYPLPLYVPLPSSLWRLFKSSLKRAWFASVLSEIVQFNWYFLRLIAVCKIFPWIFIFENHDIIIRFFLTNAHILVRDHAKSHFGPDLLQIFHLIGKFSLSVMT